MKYKTATICLFIALFSIGCWPENDCQLRLNFSRVDQSQLARDIEIIDNYLSENNIEAEIDDSGLRYVINTQGDGPQPELCSIVSVDYSGTLLSNGEEFDRSEAPVRFSLGNLILGWQVGLQLIQAGGNITLYVPSQLAYGRSGTPSIPENANLIFQIELQAVN